MSNRNIERVLRVINRNAFQIGSTMDYERVVDCVVRLADIVSETETDDDTWYIGENYYVGLADLITGAYWHFTEWHGGQNSKGYLALCKLGQIFDPGMSMPETDNEAYMTLGQMAEQHFYKKEA